MVSEFEFLNLRPRSNSLNLTKNTEIEREVFMYLRLCAGWIHQVLAGHLNRLVSPSELSGIHEALLTS